MTAVELKYRHRKFDNFTQIHLDPDDERCGEIYITLRRTLIFHCSICESNFGSYDYFLDHVSTEHYEDVQGEVIEIDAETEISDIETASEFEEHNFEDYSLDQQLQEQDSLNECNDDEYECAEVLQKAEIDYKPKFEQIEEVFLEEAYSFSGENSEQIVEEFEDFNGKKIKDEAEIEKKSSQRLNVQTSGTKTKKGFSCNECGKAFKTNQKLRRHYVTHSDERNHKCKICGFAFKDQTNLDSHMQRHLGIKKKPCGYCPKMFFTTTEATNHRRTHTGERPFVCPTCGISYSTACGLKVHVKKHSAPEYKCNCCGKGFYGKTEFKDHMLVHTKEKPFVCHICAARFPRYNSMIRHTKLMHERKKK